MSVARRVTRQHPGSAGILPASPRHCVPGAARRYAIGPWARNTAGVTFATGCYGPCSPEPFRRRLPSAASHPLQDDPAVGAHLRGPPPQRIGDAGRQAGALLPVKSIDRDPVIVP